MMDNPTQIAYVQRLDTIKARLYQLNQIDRLSWRKIAKKTEFSGIPAGTLCAISKGRVPKDNTVRMILGLPALALAPVCSKCGEVHESKVCPHDRKPASARVKHRCGTCKWWDINHKWTDSISRCKSDKVYRLSSQIVCDADFGCRFWHREEGCV